MADDDGETDDKKNKKKDKKKDKKKNKEPDIEVPEYPVLWKDEDEKKALLKGVAKENPKPDRISCLIALRDKALVTELREDFWNDEELRSTLIDLARGPDPDAPKKSLYNDGPEIPDEDIRQVVLGIFFHLAMSAPNRRAMTRDPATVEAILMGTTKEAADQDQGEPLRRRAFMALAGIALAGACAYELVDENEKNHVADGLIRGLVADFNPNTRADVLGTLWSMALAAEVDVAALWKYAPLREATIACATPGEPPVVRENALGLLWTLSNSDRNRTEMWHHEELVNTIVRGVPPYWIPEVEEEESEEEDELDALLADSDEDEEEEEEEEEAKPAKKSKSGKGKGERPADNGDGRPPADGEDDGEGGIEGEEGEEEMMEGEESEEEEGPKVPQPADVRIRSLRVLEGIAEEPLLREEMWANKQLASNVLDATDPDEPSDIRSAALGVLLQLALCYPNQLPMFGSGVHDIFAENKDDPHLPRLQRASCAASEARVVEGYEWAEWEEAEIHAAWAAEAMAEEYAAEDFYAAEVAAELAFNEENIAGAFYEELAAVEFYEHELAENRAKAEEEHAAAFNFYKGKGKGMRKKQQPTTLRGVKR